MCMQRGSWFNSVHVLTPGLEQTVRSSPKRPLRFVCLSPNRRTLAWGEFTERPKTNPAYDSLRDRSGC